VHPAVYELQWDEAIQEKLWTKHRVLGREVGDVVFDDPRLISGGASTGGTAVDFWSKVAREVGEG